jgi:hypothetical protein
MRQVGQARGQLGALAFADRRDQGADLGGDALDPIHALGNGGGQLRALAFTRGHELVQHLVHQRQRLGLQRGRFDRLALQHARVLQQLGEAHAHLRESGLQALGQPAQLVDQHLVDRQRGCHFRCAQAQHRIELAAVQAAGDLLAQGRLDRAQLLGQAQAQLQEAVVDRAQLAGKRAPGGCAFAAGVGGHAPNHAVSDALQRANGTLATFPRAPDDTCAAPWPVSLLRIPDIP